MTDSPAYPVFAAERAARRAVARVQERNVAWYRAHPEEIESRLAELDAEMDIDRAMDVYALRASVIGGALSLVRSRGWALVPLAAAGLLALQSATGDSALRRFLRKRGYRTGAEIAAEEDALFALLDERDAAREAADGGPAVGASKMAGASAG